MHVKIVHIEIVCPQVKLLKHLQVHVQYMRNTNKACYQMQDIITFTLTNSPSQAKNITKCPSESSVQRWLHTGCSYVFQWRAKRLEHAVLQYMYVRHSQSLSLPAQWGTSARVYLTPFLLMTTSPGHCFIFFLMNRRRCFWFMQEEAWMWVSTCTRNHTEGDNLSTMHQLIQWRLVHNSDLVCKVKGNLAKATYSTIQWYKPSTV